MKENQFWGVTSFVGQLWKVAMETFSQKKENKKESKNFKEEGLLKN